MMFFVILNSSEPTSFVGFVEEESEASLSDISFISETDISDDSSSKDQTVLMMRMNMLSMKTTQFHISHIHCHLKVLE